MGGGIMVAKLCDACKSSTATIYCRADTAYLCTTCDAKIHAANKLASRHARVWVCEVCEQSPATVTCKADAAHLCTTCDRDIHSANPLSRRHDRVPLIPFFDRPKPDTAAVTAAAAAAKSAAISKLFGDEYYSDADEAEAASWLLPNPKGDDDDDVEHKSIDFLFGGGAGGGGCGGDPYLDLDFGGGGGGDPKPNPSADCVVPDPDQKDGSIIHNHHQQLQQQHESSSMYSLSSYNHNFDDNGGCGAAGYEINKHYSLSSYAAPPPPQPSLSHSVSSSSMDFGVVPDANVMADVASTGGVIDRQQMKILGMDREARVLRYREKRKNRKFEKTIRYASRKAYAETRPRIKGRFAKRSDVEADASAASVDGLFASDTGYGVVPSF